MKSIRKTRKFALVAFNVMIMALMVMPMITGINAATRDENTQKIQDFLSNDAVNRGISERGETYERVMRNIGMMNDAQVEKLAGHANAQTVQVGGEIKDSGEDFWTFYKWYLIASLGFLLLLVLMA